MEIIMSTPTNQELWHTIFAVGHPALKSFQRLHSWLPSPPRCKMCYAPFRGIGGMFMRMRGKGPANRNPRYCNACDKFIRAYPGGAEVELSMVFVDVRGSVAIGEKLAPTEYHRVMNGFYTAATQALIDTDGFVIDLVGDAVVGVYPPGFSGPQHARKAVQAAEHLLRVAVPSALAGSPLPIGVGVHTGNVFIGTVSGAEAGIQDVRALGDNVNIAARLAQMAEAGVALISDAACTAAGLKVEDLESRELELKGRSKVTAVHVLRSQFDSTSNLSRT
jgi:adenylate cyclase